MRAWLLGAVALLFSLQAFSADTFEGVMTISHGFYLDAEGRQVSLVGKKVPYTGERIQLGEPVSRQPDIQGMDATVYSNDHGPGSYIVSALAMPSALDDVTMSGGANATWQTLTMGLNANISNPNELFLIRWTGYGTFTPGLGAGVMAFSNMLIDFGGPMTLAGQTVPGTFKLTFDVSGFNLSATSNQLYFAQQFRVWDGTGNPNTPFRMEFDTVFSRGFPSPGSSQQTFYYDFEPNNIFDEEEVDQWEAGQEANFLLVIVANQTGVVETRLPSSFTYNPGTPVSGETSDLWDSDNVYVVAGPGITFSTAQSPLRMELTSTSTTTAPTRVAMQIENRSTSASIRQQVEFWNYNTGAWVLADTRNTTTTDSIIEVEAPGTAAHYVHSVTRQMKTRLSYKAMGPVFSYPWRSFWDQAVWKITRP